MSERRKRCEEFAEETRNYVAADYIDDKKISIDALEAFAKEQQIKGMEAVLDMVRDRLASLREEFDEEIKKLKEGG